ncbi:MAG: hypothetical protein M3440_07895 [Chloroflexota bacterium]|nr:hypothetical protein [Chloroflexota bacterium]
MDTVLHVAIPIIGVALVLLLFALTYLIPWVEPGSGRRIVRTGDGRRDGDGGELV